MIGDLLAYLHQLGVGIQGQTLFAGGFPLAIEAEGVALLESSGLAPLETHDDKGVAYEQRGLQVLSRALDYNRAALLIRQAFDALVPLKNVVIGATDFLAVVPRQSPFHIGPDENERQMFSVNFDVVVPYKKL